MNQIKKAKKNKDKYKQFRSKYDSLLKVIAVKPKEPLSSIYIDVNCKISKAERIIASYLTTMGISFIREFSFPDLLNPKTQKFLRFDFYLPYLNLCIEYDGKHHFSCTKTKKSIEKLKCQQFRDRLKNKYCKENRINLIRFNKKHYYNLEKHLLEALKQKPQF